MLSTKCSAVDFALKTFNCHLEKLLEFMVRNMQVLELGLKLEICRLTDEFQWFYLYHAKTICAQFEFCVS